MAGSLRLAAAPLARGQSRHTPRTSRRPCGPGRRRLDRGERGRWCDVRAPAGYPWVVFSVCTYAAYPQPSPPLSAPLRLSRSPCPGRRARKEIPGSEWLRPDKEDESRSTVVSASVGRRTPYRGRRGSARYCLTSTGHRQVVRFPGRVGLSRLQVGVDAGGRRCYDLSTSGAGAIKPVRSYSAGWPSRVTRPNLFSAASRLRVNCDPSIHPCIPSIQIDRARAAQ